jgi:hypothetical protein
MKKKDIFLMFLIMAMPCLVLSQGVTRYGQHISSSSYFVNKNGKLANTVSLNKNGHPLAVPTLSATTAVTNATFEGGSSGGNVSDDGGLTITDRGVCWSTTSNPTTANSKISTGTGSGSFTSALVGLNPNTFYYVRAYATNLLGTVYGSQVSFTTSLVAIGDTYQGGTVAYILQSGDPGYVSGTQHGIIDGGDQGSASFGCAGTVITGARGTALGTGNQNTTDILNGCAVLGIAARVCAGLSQNGYSDWYLPSRDELDKLILVKNQLASFPVSGFILTSSQYISGTIFQVNYVYVYDVTNARWLSGSYKFSPYNVRAIRSF